MKIFFLLYHTGIYPPSCVFSSLVLGLWEESLFFFSLGSGGYCFTLLCWTDGAPLLLLICPVLQLSNRDPLLDSLQSVNLCCSRIPKMGIVF